MKFKRNCLLYEYNHALQLNIRISRGLQIILLKLTIMAIQYLNKIQVLRALTVVVE